jgi:hypothetical protein
MVGQEQRLAAGHGPVPDGALHTVARAITDYLQDYRRRGEGIAGVVNRNIRPSSASSRSPSSRRNTLRCEEPNSKLPCAQIRIWCVLKLK